MAGSLRADRDIAIGGTVSGSIVSGDQNVVSGDTGLGGDGDTEY